MQRASTIRLSLQAPHTIKRCLLANEVSRTQKQMSQVTRAADCKAVLYTDHKAEPKCLCHPACSLLPLACFETLFTHFSYAADALQQQTGLYQNCTMPTHTPEPQIMLECAPCVHYIIILWLEESIRQTDVSQLAELPEFIALTCCKLHLRVYIKSAQHDTVDAKVAHDESCNLLPCG